MNKIEIFKMAFTNLFRRKARSILAILGVLIGTASIITMVSIGLGMSKNFNDEMKKNPDLHIITIFGVGRSGSNPNKPNNLKMDDKSVKKIANITGVTKVTPVKRVNTRLIIGDYVAFTDIIGLDPEFLQKKGIKLSKGTFLKSGDKMKIMVGNQIPAMMENYKNGQYMRYSPDGKYNIELISNKVELTSDTEYKKSKNTYGYGGNGGESGSSDTKPKYEVFRVESIGLINSESEEGFSIYTTLDTIREIEKPNSKAEADVGRKRDDQYTNSREYSQFLIYIEDVNKVSDITNVLKEDGFQFYSVMDDIKREQQKFAMIQGALGGIGGISLLVAAIGITNTMIMSIYERTREIGVMKVIGASLRDIKSLFLYEAAIIGMLGGIIGSTISIILSIVVNMVYRGMNMNGMGEDSMMGMAGGYIGGGMAMDGASEIVEPYISYIPFWLIIFGILFSTLIGIIAGYIPAKKAMSLSALESLRNE